MCKNNCVKLVTNGSCLFMCNRLSSSFIPHGCLLRNSLSGLLSMFVILQNEMCPDDKRLFIKIASYGSQRLRGTTKGVTKNNEMKPDKLGFYHNTNYPEDA